MNLEVLLYVFLGGLLPAILWLWFWLKEDSAHPEPRSLIVITFIAGIIAVILVLPLQQMAYKLVSSLSGEAVGSTQLFLDSPVFVAILAFIEEAMKFGAAYVIALRSKAFDEPIDAVIFLVTAALGFTALENALFIFSTLTQSGDVVQGILTGNMRFIGASLLHVMTSAVVGLSLALSFYRPRYERQFMIFLGIIVATILHTIFNLSIMGDSDINIFATFLVLWFSVVGLLLFFEKVKRLNQLNTI